MNKLCINCKFYNLRRCLKYSKVDITGKTIYPLAKTALPKCELKLYEPVVPELEKKITDLQSNDNAYKFVDNISTSLMCFSTAYLLLVTPNTFFGHILYVIQIPVLYISGFVCTKINNKREVIDEKIEDLKNKIKKLQ